MSNEQLQLAKDLCLLIEVNTGKINSRHVSNLQNFFLNKHIVEIWEQKIMKKNIVLYYKLSLNI